MENKRLHFGHCKLNMYVSYPSREIEEKTEYVRLGERSGNRVKLVEITKESVAREGKRTELEPLCPGKGLKRRKKQRR